MTSLQYSAIHHWSSGTDDLKSVCMLRAEILNTRCELDVSVKT